MKITVRAPIVHLCPHVNELDVGTVEMTFTGLEAPELHGLRRRLESFAGIKATHEAVTDILAQDYPNAEIVTYWMTAGMEVEVRP